MQPLNNEIVVPLLNHEGEEIGERSFKNIPWNELYPEEPFAIIDWLHDTKKKPTDPMCGDWNGGLYWGSAVKEGSTIGVKRDFLRHVVRYIEDGQRVQRYLLAQGIYGGVTGKIRIKILPPGTITPFGPVEDGFGYINKKVANLGYNEQPKIKFGRAKESYTFWQRIPWADVKDELTPIIERTMLEALDPANALMSQMPATFDYKRRLVELDKDMERHPFVANSLIRSISEWMARLATTVDVGTKMYIAVPTTAPKVTLVGKRVGYRYPIDSLGSIQAINEKLTKIMKAEIERIKNLEVLQVSISSKNLSVKDCLGVAEFTGEYAKYDVIICSDDIKMFDGDLGKVRSSNEITINGVVSFTQWFAAGSAVGVNAKWAKNRMGLDHDGDLYFDVDCSLLPKLWEAVSKFPAQETPKLPKTKRLIDQFDLRWTMIMKSMENLVGKASNLMSLTYATTDREMVAHMLGFQTVEAMDKSLNYFIKAGTDGYKTDVDMAKVSKQVSRLSSILQKAGMRAPYTDWPNDMAFRHVMPIVADDDNRENIKQWMDGTIAEICRITLQPLNDVFETPIEVLPLSHFVNWAKVVSEASIEEARAFQDFYNARAATINWEDPKKVQSFRAQVDEAAKKWVAKSEFDRQTCCAALWRIGHGTRSTTSSAAAVFYSFPEECMDVVREKAGKLMGVSYVLCGLQYQLPNVEGLSTEIDVVEVHIGDFVRKAAVAIVDGQIQPTDMRYPRNMLGTFDLNSPQPDTGHYAASIKRRSRASWSVELA